MAVTPITVPPIAKVGGITAFLSGLLGMATANPSQATWLISLIVAVAGLVSALAALVVPIANAFIITRGAERKAKWERHDFANKLEKEARRADVLNLEVEQLKSTVHTQAARIHVLEGIVTDQRETIVLIAKAKDLPEGTAP